MQYPDIYLTHPTELSPDLHSVLLNTRHSTVAVTGGDTDTPLISPLKLGGLFYSYDESGVLTVRDVDLKDSEKSCSTAGVCLKLPTNHILSLISGGTASEGRLLLQDASFGLVTVAAHLIVANSAKIDEAMLEGDQIELNDTTFQKTTRLRAPLGGIHIVDCTTHILEITSTRTRGLPTIQTLQGHVPDMRNKH